MSSYQSSIDVLEGGESGLKHLTLRQMQLVFQTTNCAWGIKCVCMRSFWYFVFLYVSMNKTKKHTNKNCVARCYFYQRRQRSAGTRLVRLCRPFMSTVILFLFGWTLCITNHLYRDTDILLYLFLKEWTEHGALNPTKLLPFSRKKEKCGISFVFISCSFHLMGHKSIKYIH